MQKYEIKYKHYDMPDEEELLLTTEELEGPSDPQ